MTEKKEEFKCVECGNIEERDLGFAESRDPSPEVNIMSIPPSIPASEPVEKKEKGEEKEYFEIGLHYVIGDCHECGGGTWERVSFGSLDKHDEKKESKPKDQEPPPKEQGFQDVVPPSPEVNPADVMFTDTHNEGYNPLNKKDEKPRPEKREELFPVEKGFQDVIPPSPEVNPADVMFTDTHGDMKPTPKAKRVEKPEPNTYKCTGCGEEEKSELDKDDLGTCSACGFKGWEQTHH